MQNVWTGSYTKHSPFRMQRRRFRPSLDLMVRRRKIKTFFSTMLKCLMILPVVAFRIQPIRLQQSATTPGVKKTDCCKLIRLMHWRVVEVDLSQLYVVNTTFPLGYKCSKSLMIS